MRPLFVILCCSICFTGCKKTTFASIEVNLPELKYFAEGKTEVLLKQLQASPMWQVAEDKGETVCYRRIYENGKWQIGSYGYERSPYHIGETEEEFYSIQYVLRFSEKPFGTMKADKTSIFDPLAGKVKMTCYRHGDNFISSRIAIGQKGLWFEFYEERKKEPRIHTAAALVWLKSYLEKIKDAEEEILQNGFAVQIMPPDSIKTGSSVMEVCDGSQPGIYIVNAWVNPKKNGYVYLKVFDIKKNVQLSAISLNLDSKEYIGYSLNPDQLFFYNCDITIGEGDPNNFYDARFELWFSPFDGTAETKLIEKTREIRSWER